MSEPAPALVRLIANRELACIGWDDLRLSATEIKQIASAKTTCDEATLKVLHQQSDGWAAGLTLLLAGAARQAGKEAHSGPHEAVFDYFAEQVFRAVPAATQHLLLTTCLPPQVTVAMAESLSSDPGAGKILEGRARALTQQLRCVVCQNQSVDDSDAPLAKDLRLLVRERLVATPGVADVAVAPHCSD